MAIIVEFTLDVKAFPFGRSTSGDPTSASNSNASSRLGKAASRSSGRRARTGTSTSSNTTSAPVTSSNTSKRSPASATTSSTTSSGIPTRKGRPERGDDAAQAVADALAESHLPALADAGYIEWNPETETIRRGPDFEQVSPVLRLLNNPTDIAREEQADES